MPVQPLPSVFFHYQRFFSNPKLQLVEERNEKKRKEKAKVIGNVIEKLFKKNIQERFINRFWLGEVIHGDESNAGSYFPYQPETGGAATVDRSTMIPKKEPELLPAAAAKNPAFLVNIPVGHVPLTKGYKKIRSMVEMLSEETFGLNATKSCDQAQKKLAVVFGFNQIKSIDPDVNDAFELYIKKMPLLDGLPYRVNGFFWEPTWEPNGTWKEIDGVEQALEENPSLIRKKYPQQKAFDILKRLDHKRAEQVRQQLEGESGLSKPLRSQIPFQRIRQKIKDSSSTEEFAETFASTKKIGPIFFVTMDADFKKLRTNKKGYFTHYEEIIAKSLDEKRYAPSIISLGYQLSDDELPILRLAVECDQAVREAMNRHLPGSCYMPEPGTGYNFSGNGKFVRNLEKFSFLADRGDKNRFESRRAINNGILSGILDQSRTCYVIEGALVTATPGRMITDSPIPTKYRTLTSASLKSCEVLGALRNVSQVHFDPVIGWAHNLFQGLPKYLRVGQGIHWKMSGMLAKVFAPFDPIGLAMEYDKISTKSFRKVFDKIFGSYEKYSKALFKAERKGNFTKRRGREPQIKLKPSLEKERAFIQDKFTALLEAKAELEELGFDDEWQEKVIDVARASGLALFSTISAELETE